MVFTTTTIKDILNESDAGVHSECGKLDIVLMHRPGGELLRLTNDNLHVLLFDAIPDINQTHHSHDIYSQYLRDHGVHVLYLTDLLRETLISSIQARSQVIDGILTHSHLNHENHEQSLLALQQWLLHRTPEQLTEDISVGVAYSRDELGTSDNAQILLTTNDLMNEYLIPPLPNLLFTRDAFSIMDNHVFIWQMNKPARQNESLLLQAIFQYHPHLSNCGLEIIEWREHTDEHNTEIPTVEGGDVAYLGDGILLIGCGERTNRLGIEALSRTGIFHQIIVIMIPPQRSYMHLDTVLSSVGKNAFTLHGLLAKTMEVYTIENQYYHQNTYFEPEWISHGCDVRQALRNILNNPNLIFYDAKDEQTSIDEQAHDRFNVLAIDDNHVTTYAGGDATNGLVACMTQNNMCRVGLIPVEGLLEGGGGAHCMTNAIRRRTI
ncbi:unnamed protein product [Adineta steineri]|uniref:Arginine deiminase n=1 Tax=Adineta steineri TaxID=433720 RepID=A0A818USR9_9BILA|nr:unnamed protein product [Adineta steineri]